MQEDLFQAKRDSRRQQSTASNFFGKATGTDLMIDNLAHGFFKKKIEQPPMLFGKAQVPSQLSGQLNHFNNLPNTMATIDAHRTSTSFVNTSVNEAMSPTSGSAHQTRFQTKGSRQSMGGGITSGHRVAPFAKQTRFPLKQRSMVVQSQETTDHLLGNQNSLLSNRRDRINMVSGDALFSQDEDTARPSFMMSAVRHSHRFTGPKTLGSMSEVSTTVMA